MLGTATLRLHRLRETRCPHGTCSPGTSLLCLLLTGLVLSLPGFCCLLWLKQKVEVTTFASSTPEGCVWSQSTDGQRQLWWVEGNCGGNREPKSLRWG